MRPNRSAPLRGSVSQNNVAIRMRARASAGMGLLTRLGITAALMLALLAAGIVAWQLGWPQRQIRSLEAKTIALTQKAQFAVKDITVTGRKQQSAAEIIDALGIARGAAILDFDPHAAALRIGKLPWIESVVVERRLPDTIAVILTERVAVARWQHDDKTYIIDRQGQVVPGAHADDFPALPLVVGSGADQNAQALIGELKAYPEIESRLDSAVRVGERRWDLHLRPRLTVRLPEEDEGAALHRLSVLIGQDHLLDRDIVALDLRIPDRLVLEPAPAATPKTGGKPAGAPKHE